MKIWKDPWNYRYCIQICQELIRLESRRFSWQRRTENWFRNGSLNRYWTCLCLPGPLSPLSSILVILMPLLITLMIVLPQRLFHYYNLSKHLFLLISRLISQYPQRQPRIECWTMNSKQIIYLRFLLLKDKSWRKWNFQNWKRI